jgi:predicted dinucleotide-utilizing enzyme
MKITFLGGGNMANALIGGLVQQGFAATDIAVIELSAEGREKLQSAYRVRCVEQIDAAAAECDVLVLAVKPQQMKAAVAPLVPLLKQQVVVSIAAGLRLDDMSRWLGGHRKLVRTMPNTPALIGAGVTGLNALPEVSAAERAAAEKVLQAVGCTRSTRAPRATARSCDSSRSLRTGAAGAKRHAGPPRTLAVAAAVSPWTMSSCSGSTPPGTSGSASRAPATRTPWAGLPAVRRRAAMKKIAVIAARATSQAPGCSMGL